MPPTFQPPTTSLSPGIGATFGTTASGAPPIRSTVTPTSTLTNKPVSFASATKPASAAPDTNYFMQAGENPQAYQSRISSYNAQQTATGGTSPVQTGTGSTIATNGNGLTQAPTGFTIGDTNVNSSMLAGGYSTGDVMNQRKTYADYVNGLSQAQQYSPDYVAALQAKQAADANASKLQTNFYTGNPNLGDTVDYAQGETAKALQLNSQQQLAANQALDVQTLLRQGNIAAATALVQANAPVSVSPGSSLVSPTTGQEQYSGLGGYQAVQGIQTVNNLAQQYPDAGILPTDSLAQATQKASQSGKFASEQTVQVSLPGGGITFVNKNQLVPGPGGQTAIISAAQATAADAASKAVSNLTSERASISSAINTVDNNFPLLNNVVSQYGLNTGIPLQNQIQQKIGGQLGQSAIVQLNALATGLKATIAQIVSRGGAVDDKTRSEADALLPTNVSFKTLQDLERVVKSEGQGVLSGMDTEIARQTQTLNGIYSTATPLSSLGQQPSAPASSGSGSIYDF